jgi:hypothetical protein
MMTPLPANEFPAARLAGVNAVGFGLLAHRTSLLDAVGPDPFTLDGPYGEDFSFCRRVELCSGVVLADCAVIAGHVDAGVVYLPNQGAMRLENGRLVPTRVTNAKPKSRSYGAEIDAGRAANVASGGNIPLHVQRPKDVTPEGWAELERIMPRVQRDIAAGNLKETA